LAAAVVLAHLQDQEYKASESQQSAKHGGAVHLRLPNAALVVVLAAVDELQAMRINTGGHTTGCCSQQTA